MEPEGTVVEETGKETEKVEDLTEQVVDKTTSEGDKATSGALSEADTAKIKTMQSLLDEFNIDSPEDLKTLVKNLAQTQDQIGDADIAELKANADLLKRYQKAWAQDREKDLEENETPEETIARLKKEKTDERNKLKAIDEEQREARESAKLVKSFSKTVKSAIKAQEDLPIEYHGMLSEYLGVDNEIQEIDIGDKAAIKRITKAATKKMMDFEQTIIKRYLAGKSKIAKVSSTKETPAPETKKVKTLKDARGVLKERLNTLFKS